MGLCCASHEDPAIKELLPDEGRKQDDHSPEKKLNDKEYDFEFRQ